MFTVWLEMFILLKSEVVATNGLGRELLLQADALDGDTIELLAQMGAEANDAHEAKRKAESQGASGAAAFERIGRR